jgi:hypothetical protein
VPTKKGQEEKNTTTIKAHPPNHTKRRNEKMDALYKSRHIHSLPELDPDTDCWVPKARVLWEERGALQHQLLTGLHDRFKIIDQAETYAVEMAKAWIDAELIDNLTP